MAVDMMTMRHAVMALPTHLLDRMEDSPRWHRIRGHHVDSNIVMGNGVVLHRWTHYCHTCECAW
jgi:hypothetical protein